MNKSKKEDKLIIALTDYINNVEPVEDAIYEYIDGKRYKVSLCTILTEHKKKLKRIENLLRCGNC